MNFGVDVTSPSFGGPINGDWTPAFQNAVDSLRIENSHTTGGVIFIPRGVYVLKNELIIRTFETHPNEHLASITLEGEGMHSSILDFNQEGSGLTVQHSTLVKLRGFSIKNSTANNIKIQPGEGHIELTNIRSKGAAENGLLFENGTFLISLKDVFSSHNTENGFLFEGLHTSIDASACFAAANTMDGWVLKNIVYSSFNSCAADKNRHGWNITNVRTLKLTGCGAEMNNLAGFYVNADSSETHVDFLSMESCFGIDNNKANLGYSNLCHLMSTSTGKVTVSMKNCQDAFFSTPTSPYSVVVYGTGSRLVNDNNKFATALAGAAGGVATLVQYSRELGPLTITGADTEIMRLRDTYNSTVTFGGMLTIEARNKNLSDSNANTATYVLLVSKTVTGTSLTEIAKLGLTQGSGSSWPSFIFSLDPAGKLKASPVASTSGDFHFLITASGNISLYTSQDL